MTVPPRRKDQREWFGVAPPDLSVIARSRGADWLYTYLRSFYRDDRHRLTGWNNLVFANVGMPHVLWQLQGTQVLKSEIEEHGGQTGGAQETGAGVPRNLVRHWNTTSSCAIWSITWSYMGEPAKTRRVQIGIVVLFFLSLLLVLSWLLKKEYWKDVH